MSSRNDWHPAGTITVQQAALGVTARDQRTVDNLADATKVVVDLTNDYHEVLEVRGWSDGSENDVNVVNVYASRGKTDYVHLIGTITMTQGTQDKGDNHFVDTMSVEVHDESFLFAVVQSGNNQMARVFIDTNGYRKFYFIATTLATTTLGIDVSYADSEIHAVLPSNSLLKNSDDGGSEVLSIGATSADAGADQPCRSCIVWTPDDDIHMKIGSDAADANDPLIPADTIIPMPVSNTSFLRFYNAGGGAETVNVIWRS